MLDVSTQPPLSNDDLQDLHRRCQALEKENNYYKALFSDMLNTFLQLDRNGIVIMCNKNVAWYLGGTPETVIGKNIKDLLPKDGDELIQIAQRVIDTEKPCTFDRQISYPIGKRWSRAIVYSATTPFRSERIVHVEAADITEEKAFQEELLATERRRSELESCLRKAQKIDIIGTLAGGIAHDFNNILSAIIGFTELVIADLTEITTNTIIHDNLTEILAAGMRAKDLIRQILTFSRQVEQELQPVQVRSIVREMAGMLRSTIPTTIEIEFDNQTHNSMIFGDPSQIHQVVLNLCTNSVYAMQEKGGRLEIILEEVEFDHPDTAPFQEMDLKRPYLLLTVQDTGTGIAPEVLARIFEPYVTTKPSGQGTGLGLAVAHGIVRSHNGFIKIISQPNEGTTVRIYLPLLISDELNQVVPHQDIPRGQNEHLLVVDDEPQIIHMYRQTLERLRYKVSTHTSSLEALEAFKSNPQQYRAVITDMTMPNLTGDRLAQQIRYLSSDIPIILCTGYGDKITRAKAKSMGIDLILLKPVERYDLAKALQLQLTQNKNSVAADQTASSEGVDAI